MVSLDKYSFERYGRYTASIHKHSYFFWHIFHFLGFNHFEIPGPQMASTSSHLSADPLYKAGNLSFTLWQQVIVSFHLFYSYYLFNILLMFRSPGCILIVFTVPEQF